MAELAAVAAVLALLGAWVWLARRGGLAGVDRAGRRGQARLAERVGRLALGPGQALELVRIRDRVLVIAVHASGCSLLETLEWSEVAPGGGESAR